MKVLSLETSCDETSFALGEINKRSGQLLTSTTLSQTETHRPFGGVVPNLTAREHLKNFKPLLNKTLKKAGIELSQIDLFSVAAGPGLIPALLVGVSIAKAFSFFYQKPLLGLNHLEAHLYSGCLEKSGRINPELKFPAIALIVSGGHTQLVLLTDFFNYQILGETIDDACGEAFDKAARILKLGYPGGAAVAIAAEKGDPHRFNFPRPMIQNPNLNFSFSGLKTALLYQAQKEFSLKKHNPQTVYDLAASFSAAALEVLIKKTERASQKFKPKTLILGGGVSANKNLRKDFQELGSKLGCNLKIPLLSFAQDNAAMQLPLVFFLNQKDKIKKLETDFSKIEAKANMELVSLV
jgi:N6-L-threonylcarbamoyladenine synthase